MRILCSLICLFLVTGVHAQEMSASGESRAIIALELKLTNLIEHGAIEEYASHLAPDYTLTTPEGQVINREGALAFWRAQGPGYKMTPTEMHVRVYGNTAILSARVVGPSGGAGDRITKTFVRIKGKWLLAALHVSQIAEPPK
jgi:hypothetical protein